MPFAKTTLCDFPVARLTPSEMHQFVEQRAAAGEGGWLVTLNLEMFAKISRDSDYESLLRQADWFTADGMPVVWASRFPKTAEPIKERTTGVDLVAAILANPESTQYAVIGGVDPMRAIEQYAGARERCGYMFKGKVDLSDAQVEMFAKELADNDVRLVFLALGVPKQDALALALRRHYPKAVYMGIGGTFEMLAPEGKRAPQWMQKSGLEWLYRFTVDPGRLWRRYLLNYPVGAKYLISDILARRKAS